jgi:tetratricopeptide (TPR) repeat protein
MAVSQVKISDKVTVFIVKDEEIRKKIEKAIEPSILEKIKEFVKDGSYEEELFEYNDNELIEMWKFKTDEIFERACFFIKYLSREKQNKRTTLIFDRVGYYHFLKGNYSEAIIILNKIIIKYFTKESWYWCGRAYYNQRIYSKAINEFSHLKVKDDKKSQYMLAMCKINTCDYVGSIVILEKIDFKNQDLQYDLYRKLDSCYNNKDIDRKIEYLEKAKNIKKDYNLISNLISSYRFSLTQKHDIVKIKNIYDYYNEIYNLRPNKDMALMISKFCVQYDYEHFALEWLKKC